MNINLKYMTFDDIHSGVESLAQNKIASKTINNSKLLLNTDISPCFHLFTNLYISMMTIQTFYRINA